MKRITSLVALIIITNFPVSCSLGCGPFDTRPNIIISISSNIGSVVEGEYSETISTNFNAAAIRAVVNETQRVGWNNNSYTGMLNLAYACSPPSPNIQTLSSIQITSTESVFADGIEFRSGDNLEVLFKAVNHNFEQNVVAFNDSPKRGISFGGFEGESIAFQLISQPDNALSQQFTFIFTFDDGLEYQVLTPLFTVD